MKYIILKEDQWYFDNYFQMLDVKKNKIPAHLLCFLQNKARYDLHSQESLHDSWLTNFTLSMDNSPKISNIQLKFIGPYHDTFYIFDFKQVINFQLQLEEMNKNDLLIHEFTIFKKGVYCYEFLFSNESYIKIYFKSLEITEQRAI
jgi:hypothetical protein